MAEGILFGGTFCAGGCIGSARGAGAAVYNALAVLRWLPNVVRAHATLRADSK